MFCSGFNMQKFANQDNPFAKGSAMNGDGVFVDCRSHWKGRIGAAAVSFAKYEGGAVHIGKDGADRRIGLSHTALRLSAHLRLTCTSEPGAPDHGQSVLIRQENDPAPKFHFLEEGAIRLGMRVAFDLLDDEGHYHGDGRIDLWIYPEGDMHLTYNLQLVDQLAHSRVHDAYLEIRGADTYRRMRLGDRDLEGGGAVELKFGADLPDKRIVFSGDDGAAGLNEGDVDGKLTVALDEFLGAVKGIDEPEGSPPDAGRQAVGEGFLADDREFVRHFLDFPGDQGLGSLVGGRDRRRVVLRLDVEVRGVDLHDLLAGALGDVAQAVDVAKS